MMSQTTFEDYNEDVDITPCGECWWCWERKWAEDPICGIRLEIHTNTHITMDS